MLKKNRFLQGTLILTTAGVLTRIIGFFYRIFLARVIGEEGLGIYQLISPVMALSFSLTCSGIQSSLSKYVAAYHARNEPHNAFRCLLTGFILSFFLSTGCGIFLFQNDVWIAQNLLLEQRCHSLIRLFSLSLPFACLHSCVNGYYYGLKRTVLPSTTQLLEQLSRVGSIYLIFLYAQAKGLTVSFSLAMIGNLIGELVSSLVSLVVIYIHFVNTRCFSSISPGQFLHHSITLSKMALPLTANRFVLNILQSVEAVYIPNRLMAYGMSNRDALKSYGVLTGMALPLLLFPTALTSSVSVLLLPYISEAQAKNQPEKIKSAIGRCACCCIFLGSLCCVFLLLCGNFLGSFLFDSTLASDYIRMLSITCPTLYVSSVLTSILHGLGKTLSAFLCQVVSLGIRIGFVFLMIPFCGMSGYILGIFVSQLVFTLLILLVLKQDKKTQSG